MKYALVDGELQEAQPGLSSNCKCCDRQVVAKCGKVKIWHWAHKGKRMCDPWWENETEWHRAWKGQFPKEWQEIIQYAENGEKHIADVKIDQGYVIEFQHSPIKPEERQSREHFYKKMIWIVDGTRRLRDKKKFIEVLEDAVPVDGKTGLRRLRPYFDECALLRDWVGSNVPVFFDFGEDILWGILPKTIEEEAYVFKVERNALISSLRSELQINSFEALLKDFTNLIEQDERYLNWKARETLPPFLRSFQPRSTNYSPRKRF